MEKNNPRNILSDLGVKSFVNRGHSYKRENMISDDYIMKKEEEYQKRIGEYEENLKLIYNEARVRNFEDFKEVMKMFRIIKAHSNEEGKEH